MSTHPDARSLLSGLKDFQRRTVDVVFDRLWGPNPTSRFLVADEVGLGKTLVAQGVVTRTIEHLRELGEERIDIVYICSNSQIAQQNLRRLHAGMASQVPHADRLTLLPRALAHMNRTTDDGPAVNIVSFTPGTSFSLRSNGGVAGERALLQQLLRQSFDEYDDSAAWDRFFRGRASEERMAYEHRGARRQAGGLAIIREAFQRLLADARVEHDQPLTEVLLETVEAIGSYSSAPLPYWLSSRRYSLLGELRQLLAQACVAQLNPDLVILDEFQRFGHLLHGADDASLLARDLLGDESIDPTNPHTQTRVLLLSATPFKMYTLPDEPEGEDHYRDFEQIIGFLGGSARAHRVRTAMAQMREALIARNFDPAVEAKDRAQHELRQVMVRTERLAVSVSRDGMLTDRGKLPVQLTSWDVHAFARQAAISQAAGGHDMLEYWRSAPYALELMESYKVKRNLLTRLDSVADTLGQRLTSRVSHAAFHKYEEVDLSNPKLRWLADDVLGHGAAEVAWLPPSLPYYQPAGAFAAEGLPDFTKRLIFSAWAVAPKGIASLLSYEVERRLIAKTGTTHRYFDPRRTGLLTFPQRDGRLAGMALLALLNPSPTLAELGDPLRIARELDVPLPMDRDAIRAEVRGRLASALAEVVPESWRPASGPGALGPGAWYVLAPLLLDRRRYGHGQLGGLRFGVDRKGAAGDDDGLFGQHVRAIDTVELTDMPAPPENLLDVLTELALAGPAVSALRALHRAVDPQGDVGAGDLRSAASDWAWALRAVFNAPEVMAMLGTGEDDRYWHSVLQHCLDGNLQAVLDEYVAVLMATASLHASPRETQLLELAKAFQSGSGLRASAQAIDLFDSAATKVRTREHLRSHFAARYGRQQHADTQAVERETQVRDAFNSPFWPFVLASTSVGQEGLDFHHYSHAVVHWNLPSNPVDLEQREGRVHRFRGHAVRKNVARSFLSAGGALEPDRDPWAQIFEWAASLRADGVSEIFPDWVFPLDGGATIDRYVPALPLSRETQQYRRLLRTLGAYRLTLGQPRQQDMLAYVQDADVDLALDLSP